MTLLDDFQRFLVDAQSGSQYQVWEADNCGAKTGGTVATPAAGSDLGLWYAFRDAIVAGQRPAPPSMQTAHGRELVDAGVQYLDATAPAPPPSPPTPPSGSWPLPPLRTPTIVVAAGAPATGAGTVASPMPLQGALAKMQPGDVIGIDALKGPIVTPSGFYLSRSGTAVEWIQWVSLNGTAVIQGKGGTANYNAIESDGGVCYHDFRGIWFDGEYDGELVQAFHALQKGHHFLFAGCRITRMGAAGLIASGADYLWMIGNDVWRFGDTAGWSSGISWNNGSAPYWFDSARGYHNLIVGNRIAGGIDGSSYDTDGNGIILDLTGAWSPTLCAGNVCYMNGGRGILKNTPGTGKFHVINNTCWKNSLDLRRPGEWGEIVANQTENDIWANNIAVASSGGPAYRAMGAAPVNVKNLGFGASSGVTPAIQADPQLQAVPTGWTEGQPDQWQKAPQPWTLADAAFLPGAGSPALRAGVDPRTLAGLDSIMVEQIAQWVGVDRRGIVRDLSAPTLGALEAA